MIPALRSALAVVALMSAPAFAKTDFLTRLADVPLTPGLVERAEEAFSFPSGAGRLDESTAAGRLDAAAVRRYYAAALPALGWAADGPDAFVRGRERLTLAFATGSDGALTVRFRLVASPASLALD